MDQLPQTPPSRGPQYLLARAGALTLSVGIVAFLMIQAGLPGCFAGDPPIQAEPRSADTPAVPPAKAAPGAAANEPTAAPASPAPSPAPSPAAEDPTLAEPAAPNKNSKSNYFPGTKSGAGPFPIELPPPQTPQNQAPSPPPQKAGAQGKP